MGPLGIYCDTQLRTFIGFLNVKTSGSLHLYLFFVPFWGSFPFIFFILSQYATFCLILFYFLIIY